MEDSALKPLNQPINFTTEKRFWRGMAYVLAGTTVFFYIVYLVAAIQYRSQPFLGFFITNTNVVSAAAPSSDRPWTGNVAGIRRQDEIIQINGETLKPADGNLRLANQNYLRVVSNLKIFDTVNVVFKRDVRVIPPNPAICQPAKEFIATCTVIFSVIKFPDADLLAFFAVPYIAGLIVLLIGFVVLRFRGTKTDGLMASFICFLTAIFMGGIFDLGTTLVLPPVWIFTSCLLGGTLICFSITFPTRLRVVWRYPIIQYVPLVFSLVVASIIAYGYFRPVNVADNNYGQLTTTFTLVCLGAMVGFMLAFQRPRALTLVTRRQTDLVLIGTFLTIIPGILWIINRAVLASTALTIPISFETLTPLFVFPTTAIAFAILQYRRFDTDKIISQSITYGIMLAALIVSTFLLSLGGSLIALDLFNATNIFSISIVIFAMVMLFTPLRTRLQDRIDEIYFRSRRNYQSRVEEFGQKLVSNNRYEDIAAEFSKIVNENIAPSGLYIFVQTRENGEYGAYNKNTEVRFASDSPLVAILARVREAIVFNPGEPLPTSLYSEQARLRVLRAQVIAPLQGTDKLNGFVVISNPLSDKMTYTYEETRFINLITNQLSVGTERSQIIGSLERRVRELDVLSQVGQAVNFTIEFDDLLELINAQTSKLVDAPCFYIALYEETINQLYFAFFLEKDDRDSQKENVRWTLDNGLFSEVVRSAKPIRVDNYAFEMDKRGVPINLEFPTLRSWMGVPLNAGRRTLGVIAVGKLKASDGFNDEQFKIFSDIGALAATSIDKARLFTETKVRERQLTVLNDISRQLVATESDVEKLLEIIMTSAVEILNCEAGSLLLTAEDDANVLEFRVVIGGAESLLGTRIDGKKGIAGEVVKTGRSLIANDVANNQSNQKVSEQYKTQSLLAVPLIAKNSVIGVLEVLNKKDGTIFIQDDAELLTTFAGQAAVAIENARLFRMTDLQLAQRVKELETLERIDSELNRTLDVTEVATITVKSAMQTLNAQAGALGIVHESPPYLEIVGIEGYTESDYPPGADGLNWPLDAGIVRRVLRSHQPDLASDVTIDPDYKFGLSGSLSQITLPMFSGDDINAILILEKSQAPRFGLNDWAYSQRIAEHASIAIANAQLYAALTQANKSKSEFMGFAAHELKNPLTSVIGFADLLRQGMTGQLTDQQQGLVNIIHSNANRMQTIIQDLRDSARMDANEFSVEVAPMNIRHTVIETLRPFVHVMKDKNQELINHVPDDLPLILGDETRLIQVLTNLVSNANKYSPPNTTITIEAKVIENYVDREGRKREPMMRISVIDQGLGISKEDQARLFKERYFRSSNLAALQQPGTGLGMTLTFGIMQKHKGELWVESELGSGSTFHISIPLAPQALQTRIGELASD